MASPARLAEEKLRAKNSLLAKLEASLSPREVEEARRDHHARRRPRPCGMTVHTGTGCRFGCLYCYVPDMGFSMKPQPYKLSGLQIAYALLSNPYFVPGRDGTLIALGSVTEPFQPETMDRALEYIEALGRLGNPQQASTKAALPRWAAERIARADPGFSLLVSVSTIRAASVLEPGAPRPEERLAAASEAAKAGLHVALFMRPIIPGVTDREAEEILEAAKRAGIGEVVLGSMRVTQGILRRLSASRVVDVAVLEERMTRRPRSSRDQVTLAESDLKKRISSLASSKGLKVLPSSCAANISSHGLGCWACRWGPCGEPGTPPSPEEVAEAATVLGCSKASAERRGIGYTVACSRPSRSPEVIEEWLRTLTRRPVSLHISGGVARR